MKLDAWMKETGRTAESLSRELEARGCRASADLVRKVLAEKKRFGIDTISEIEKISAGSVTFRDLFVPLADLDHASNE